MNVTNYLTNYGIEQKMVIYFIKAYLVETMLCIGNLTMT